MNTSSRKQWIRILRNPEAYDGHIVFEALFKLYHDPEPGDEELIYPLLRHEDGMVVAWALYALCNVYEHRHELRDLIFEWSLGDPRDCMEMPIQCMALEQLAYLALEGDREAHDRLWEVAENAEIHEVPRHRAWSCLARLYQEPWIDSDMDEMIDNPFSEASEKIRQRIRDAARQKGSWNWLMRAKNTKSL